MSATIDFGIDLGTTNSCVARCEAGGVRVFQNNDQMNVTPSAVYINRAERRFVGYRAYSALRTDPNNVATEFKRWMGQKHRHTFVAAKQSLAAEELSAEILKSLREDVRRHTGIDMTTAVITVPAAFGALQCEATARAAQLAGIVEVHLLQEPIAAAVGYGARTEGTNQHWLVFDLGGGTLDIAVVSTREGRLNVLAHMGNNLRGGKDIDRLMVDEILLPAIRKQFDIGALLSGALAQPFIAQLRSEAESAKIALSTDTQVSVSLFNLGHDDSGKSIELELELMRTQVESLMEPLLDECLALATAALSEARIDGKDLDRVLLVGGPTQTPVLRSRLSHELGASVDFSIDPMTVVARGAALYASTLPCKAPMMLAPAANCVPLKLAYEAVSVELTCEIEGRVVSTVPGLEVKVDAEGGFWTSGWIALSGDVFVVNLHLKEGQVTTFRVSLRDKHGRLLDTDTPEFKIRHGLVPSAPPLPHSISVEVAVSEGKSILDIVFPKGTPLPAEKTIEYRAAHTLIPGKSDSSIYIKLWEGEFLEAPDANELINALELSHDGIKRRLQEGSGVEVTVQINTSRLITVSAFVPSLNQHFSNKIYLPTRDEENVVELAAGIGKEIRDLSDELQELSDSGPSDPTFQEQLDEIQSSLFDLEYKISFFPGRDYSSDPDEAKRIVSGSRSIRGRILGLRYRMLQQSRPRILGQFLEMVESAIKVIEDYGNSSEKQALTALRRQLERAVSRAEDKFVQQIVEEIDELRYRVLFGQPWYWQDRLKSLSEPGQLFEDSTEAKRLIGKGQAALNDGDQDGVQEIVRSLWRLRPKTEAKKAREQSVKTGVRQSR
jgi:molecular chaperone DnaK